MMIVIQCMTKYLTQDKVFMPHVLNTALTCERLMFFITVCVLGVDFGPARAVCDGPRPLGVPPTGAVPAVPLAADGEQLLP